ncbi:hypothetical protein [Mesorhizobium sp. ISC11]|uniref:hypothetical protein n=1 Tax=Mesorhizobium sp. ISC11 TaxID=3076428 RepID=UPI00301BFDAA
MLLRLVFFVAPIFIGGLGSIVTAYADVWAVAEFRDPANAELLSAATVTNAQGYSIWIFRNNDSKVRWILSLPRNSLDRIRTLGRVAAYRIDDNDAIDVEVEAEKQSVTGLEQPTILGGRSIREILWHGQDPSPTRGVLRNMLDGQVLAIRFFFDTGNFADVTFDLGGAGSAIGPALKIETMADPNVLANARDRDDAVLISANMCQSSPNVSACLGVMTNCMGSNPNELKGDQMRSCMAAHGYPLEGAAPAANADITKSNSKTLTANCTAIGSLARTIMDKRQSGTDMSTLMSVVEDIKEGDPIKELGKQIVIQAYAMPFFNGEELKQRTISEFANDFQVKCYQSGSR